MRIGIFGGSFDPVHQGHLAVAAKAADLLGLDQVRFIPAREQPFKAGGHRASADQRLAMLRLAVEGQSRFVVDPRELHRPGPSYTVDTLRDLRREYPLGELFLLVGADAARDLPGWRDAEQIPGLARVVALTRPGAERPASRLIAQTLEVPPVDVSATAIREAARRGAPLTGLVPDPVAAHIATHHLYQAED